MTTLTTLLGLLLVLLFAIHRGHSINFNVHVGPKNKRKR